MSDAARAQALPEDDAIGVLLAQHAEIKQLFTQVEQGSGPGRREQWERLVRLLAVHETAEEEVLRPATRRIEGGDAIADARIQEEDAAKQTLSELEQMGPEAAEFAAKLEQLKTSVLHHAEREEHEEFPRIRESRSEDDLVTMGKAIKAAEATAPTHPHPNAPSSATGNIAVGPFAAVVDRARDAIRDAREGRRQG